ncbi:MAG: ZPR1 zinc finger domain-containing protein [Nanoarchaeota archaeon]|nr:ZPR1 zinc finger domain-containing protein [Nanoarchaeota archaeon]
MAKEEIKEPSIIRGQECPMCRKKALTLMEDEREVPFFGKCFLFSMTCSNCHYHKADIESAEKHEPSKYTIDISSEEDMKIRVVRSSKGTIKIPHMITMEAGESANGFISNIEGVLDRVKKVIEFARDNEDDDTLKKKAKNQLKKLTRVMWGQESLKMILEDPDGNSAIISEKAVKSKL